MIIIMLRLDRVLIRMRLRLLIRVKKRSRLETRMLKDRFSSKLRVLKAISQKLFRRKWNQTKVNKVKYKDSRSEKDLHAPKPRRHR